MSLHIDFEPHSWYRGFAIEDCRGEFAGTYYPDGRPVMVARWYAVTANGMTGYLVELEGETLKEIRQQITEYRGTK